MPFGERQIRPIAISILRRGDEILAERGFDKVKEEYFYRPLGGGIEFGETAEETLKREYQEEIGVDIKVGNRVDVVENIFTYNGKPGHELVFIYEAEFVNKKLYEKEIFSFKEEGKEDLYAQWVRIAPENKIYPEIVKNYK